MLASWLLAWALAVIIIMKSLVDGNDNKDENNKLTSINFETASNFTPIEIATSGGSTGAIHNLEADISATTKSENAADSFVSENNLDDWQTFREAECTEATSMHVVQKLSKLSGDVMRSCFETKAEDCYEFKADKSIFCNHR